jgi:two-component system response regulator AtoC
MSAPRVLVIDDEENLRRTLAIVLHQEGYDVDAVANGTDAVARLSSAIYDIVVTDMRMPGMDGLSVLEEVKRAHPDTLVVMMSAYGSADFAIEAVKRGATDYIAKPFKADELVFTLRKAVEREALRRENERLRREVARAWGTASVIHRSPAMAEVLGTVEKVADFKTTVLITGESGTGKEVIARAIHQASVRREAAFVAVNCGAIPENLLESELFGYIKGAFTDAGQSKKGLFEEADGGTLFLDEVGELPTPLQVKLLRVLQDAEIRRVGDVRSVRVDVRVIAATARDLDREVAEGRFREDLFYRLNVIRIHIPPLRDRRQDIAPLAEHFLARHAARLGGKVSGLTEEAIRELEDSPWPGNVRELENAIERAVVLADSGRLEPAALASVRDDARDEGGAQALSIKRAVRKIEADLIRRALVRTAGNRTHAARLLEISHRALLYKMKRYGVS